MATAETRQMFEQLLKKAERKKGGKEQKLKKTDKESEIVENLERSLTKDDPLLENNMYNGEAEKNLKNLRNSNGVKGKENSNTEPARRRRKVTKNAKIQINRPKQFNEACSPSSGNILRKTKPRNKNATTDNSELTNFGNIDSQPEQKFLRSLYQASETSSTQNKITNRKSVTFDTPDKFRYSVGSGVALPEVKERQNWSGSRSKVTKYHGSKTGVENVVSRKTDGSKVYNLQASPFPNRPVRITVENVDSLSNVFKTIWENHSETLIAEKMKLESDDSRENVQKYKSLPSLPKKQWHCHRQKRPIKSEPAFRSSSLKLIQPRKVDLDTKEKGQGSKYSVDIVCGVNDTGQRPLSQSHVLDGTCSEPDMYESIWKCLTDEFFDNRKMRNISSEPHFPTYKLSAESFDGIWDTSSQVTLTESFESIERILREESKQAASVEELVISDPQTRREFWKQFWKRNGVDLKFQDESSEDEDYAGSYIEEIDKDSPKKPPRAKKKKTRKKEEDEQEQDITDIYAAVKKPVKKQRTPKKKDDATADEKPAETDSPRPVPTPRKLPVFETEASPVEDQEETTPKSLEETVPKTVVRRKKKKTKRRDPTGASRALPSATEVTEQPTEETIITEEDQDAPPRDEVPVDAPPPEDLNVIQDDGTILGVAVHYCDHIRVDPKYVAHPLVKVSIVDGFTGKYFRKFDSARHVSSFYESETVSCIVPLMTQPYDFRENRSLLPRWEELLIFNEPFLPLTHHSTEPGAPKPIIFFVIRDFVPMAKANNKKGGSDKGWHNVAWGFLKLINSNGKPNAGRKMRLQLFYPPRSRPAMQDPSSDPVYDWWLNHPRHRYPGTLFVTVKAMIPPLDLESSLRSLSALQREESALTFNQMNESLERAESEGRLLTDDDDLAAMQQWSRLPGQLCKIPNAPYLRLWAGSEGAFTIRFSHKGTKLAAACRHEATYPILFYSVPGGDDIGIITGHQQLVYDLQWSKNDRYLLSASADGTAQVWDLDHKDKPIHTLPHPCYVYTASFHPTAQHLIASGGYDSIVRVWNTASVTSQLTQELDGHKAIINSIIFDSTGLNMYSADGAGVIICWNCRSYEKAKKNIKTNWMINSKIEDRDLAGVCINSLHLHPHNNKIVIHCRDSTVRLLDARIHSMKKFIGLLNYRQLLRSTVTPCGSFIFSGSEDGFVYVWNTDTGDEVAIYNELGYTNAVHAVAYHPHDHLVAFCSYSPNQYILLYKFNSAVATMEAGFRPDGAVNEKTEEKILSVNAHIEAAKTAVNLERIKNRLDSVLTISGEEFQHHPSFIRNDLHEMSEKGDTLDSSGNAHLPPIPRGRETQMVASRRSPRSGSPFGKPDTSYQGLSTWGSTFDSSTQMSTLLAPSYLSPHASPEARAMAQQYIRTGRQDQSGGWKPGVSPIGGSPYRNQGIGVPPDVSFSMDKDGKQKVNITPAPGTKSQSVVVVLFDYQANRSDELTVVRGDVIRVLYKDSANWWFGEKTSDGAQGYFPSTYVEEQVLTAEMKESETQAPVFGVPTPEKEKRVYALKMPSGRLNFYSQSESEGDDERLSNASMGSRQRRRVTKFQETLEKARDSPSPRSVPGTPTKIPDTSYPKSILHRASPRPNSPLVDGTNIKEVSFADEKKGDKKQKSKQKLLDSVQAVIAKSESESAPITKPDSPSPSSTPRQSKPKPRPSARSAKKTKPSVTHVETTFTSDPKPETQEPRTPSPKPTNTRPTFGILKSLQALMINPPLSQSVVGGPEASTPKSTETPSIFRPAVHSTAVKKPRGPVENDEDPLSPPMQLGSVIRKARPLPKTRKHQDEESIPMVQMGKSKSGRESPTGVTNPAFDISP